MNVYITYDEQIQYNNSGLYQCYICRKNNNKDVYDTFFNLYELEQHLLSTDDLHIEIHKQDCDDRYIKYNYCCYLCGGYPKFQSINQYKKHIENKNHIDRVKCAINDIIHYDRFRKYLDYKQKFIDRGEYYSPQVDLELKKFYGIYIEDDDEDNKKNKKHNYDSD